MAKKKLRVIRNDDGYTEDGEINVPAGSFSFKFRPSLSSRVFHYQAADKTTGDKKKDEVHKAILEHLVAWDVESADGKGVAKICPDSFEGIPYSALEELLDWIFRFRSKVSNEVEDAKN